MYYCDETVECILKQVKGLTDFATVGSSVTCNPPVENTDIDTLCLVDKKHISKIHLIPDLTYDGDESYESEGQFKSFRNGKYNFIFTCDEDFYDKFLFASSIAKRLNLLKKEDRIALFRAILYGEHDYGCEIESVNIYFDKPF